MLPLTSKWMQALLERGEVYAVGGSVRDDLLKRPYQDLDLLVSGIDAKTLDKVLNQYGRVQLVGKHFGVFIYTPHQSQQSFEIALPRTETSTGNNHKAFDISVDHTLPIEVDLKRRDFTINAMARRLRDGVLVDPWQGQEDLNKQIIRQVFDKTFSEDPLRMLRACQFSARLNFEIEPTTLQGITENAALVETVSTERIFQELVKLLSADKPSVGFNFMQQTGLLAQIMPELEATVGVQQPEKYHIHNVFEHTLAVIDAVDVQNTSIRWAALCHDLGKPNAIGKHKDDGRITFYGHEKHSETLCEQLLSRLKAPEALKQKVTILCRQHMFPPADQISDKALRRLIHRTGTNHILDLILLRRADLIGGGKTPDLAPWQVLYERTQQALEQGTFTRDQLALKGQDLLKLPNISPGPIIGELMDFMLDRVLEEPSLNTRAQLLDMVTKKIA